MDLPIALLFFFVIGAAVFFSIKNRKYREEMEYWIEKGRYDKALLAAEKRKDWRLRGRCWEKMESSFRNASIKEVCRNMDALIEAGHKKEVRRILTNYAYSRNEKERVLLMEKYGDKLKIKGSNKDR